MSIVRQLLRPRRGAILIGLAMLALVAALAPAGAGAGQKSAAHHLVFRLSGAAHQDVVGAGAVKVRVRCPAEACSVVASAAAKSPSVHSATARVRVPAGGSKELTIAVGSDEAAKLAAARKAGKTPTLTVHATAKDGSGNKVPLTLTVAVVGS